MKAGVANISIRIQLETKVTSDIPEPMTMKGLVIPSEKSTSVKHYQLSNLGALGFLPQGAKEGERRFL